MKHLYILDLDITLIYASGGEFFPTPVLLHYSDYTINERPHAKELVQKCLNKISGPLLDRIDIHLEVVPVPFKKLAEMESSENSETVRKRVIEARKIQEARFIERRGVYANAQMNSRLIRKYVQLDEAGYELIKNAMDKLGLSARAYDRILNVARTIADLDNESQVQAHHLSEAIHYRSLDPGNWGG